MNYRSDLISPKILDFVVVCYYKNEQYYEYLRDLSKKDLKEYFNQFLNVLQKIYRKLGLENLLLYTEQKI